MDSVDPCLVCQNLAPTSGLLDGHSRYGQPLYERLLSSAESGCVLCKVVCDAIAISGAEILPEAVRYFAIESQPEYPIRIAVYTKGDDYPKGVAEIALSGTQGNNGQLPQFDIFREVDAELKTPSTHLLAKSWIQDCVNNHPSCNSRASAEMPTRLLDLMPTESSIELRLIPSNNITANYAALSHCWGDCRTARTTSENIHSMFLNIPLSSLPRTFQDAVSLCREFQIRYLWIDSLCIIQDDAFEWACEAGRMTLVYGNAFLVIAASASSDDDIGMFPRRQGHFNHQFDFEWNGHAVSVKAQPWRQHYDHNSLGEGPLTGRAWAYQERLLGQRVLLYHQDELFWECNETWQCQCGVGDRIGDSNHPYNFRRIFDCGENDLNALYQQWYKTIVDYFAPRKLSNASDKLPAISGVAEAFRSKLDDDYMAGLWRRDIIRGLLWHNSSELWDCSLPAVYRAPSWSWASIDCDVSYNMNDLNYTACVDVLEISCTKLAEEALTGEVTDGWLTVSGLLNTAWVTAAPYGGATFHGLEVFADRNQSDLIGWLSPDCELAAGVGQTDESVEEETAIRSHWQSPMPVGDEDLSAIQPLFNRYARVWCLKIAQVTTNEEDEKGEKTSERPFIMILGRSQRQRGKFERLGMLELPVRDSKATFFDNAIITTITIV